jgi:hypothetical protein
VAGLHATWRSLETSSRKAGLFSGHPKSYWLRQKRWTGSLEEPVGSLRLIGPLRSQFLAISDARMRGTPVLGGLAKEHVLVSAVPRTL